MSDELPKLSELPELTDAEREAMRGMDMTEVLGTWEERFHVARGAALRWFRERNQLRQELATARELLREACEAIDVWKPCEPNDPMRVAQLSEAWYERARAAGGEHD